MADTGADISLLPGHHQAVVARKSRCNSTRIQPVTVDGKPIPLLGTLDLEVELSGSLVTITFFITTDPMIAPILGLDVMRRMEKVEIDFSRGDKITFGNLITEAVAEKSESPVIRRISVKLREDVIIPPRHEMIVTGKLVAEEREVFSSLHQKTLLIEPSTAEGNSVIWGRAVVSAQRGNVPIKVCNPLGREVTLHAGTHVGDAEFLPEDPVIAVISEDVMTADIMVEGSEDKVLQSLAKQADLSEEEKLVLQSYLQQYSEAFSLHGELGRYKDKLFKINTGDATPIRCMPRPVPHHKKIEIDSQLDMLQRGLIQPANSEWASPILLVKKKDGTWRFCIDYRRLNNVTKHDAFPLPNINDCLASLGGQSRYFSTLDMASGYWQMGMEEDAQEKAAFTTHRGLFKPLVQPFGPKGGVAHFSRVMHTLLGSLQWEQLLIYLDDILVFGRDFQEHLRRLGLVFSTLIKANLKLKPTKCHLFQKSVKFLGHIISVEGIQPDPAKIDAVKTWPVPVNKDAVQSFLGFMSYYRRYVRGFTQLAEPLIRLTRKSVRFEWDADCEDAFRGLRDALIEHPILTYPDFTQKFLLTTDASATGLGAVLSQEVKGQEKVVAFASRTLNKAERNYSATERECLAIVWATAHYEYYLLGAPFTIHTDHDPLTYLRSISQPHGRLARWILKLEQYDYELKYKAGKSIPHADALSRLHTQVSMIQVPTAWSREELLEAQAADKVLRRLRYYWRLKKQPPPGEAPQLKEYCRKMDQISEQDGLLLISYVGKGQSGKQLLVPDALIPQVLEKAHDEAGHFGAEKTLLKIRSHFYWTTLFKDVTAWCRTCKQCQSRKHPQTAAKAPLQYNPVASEPGQLVAMDFVGPLPETESGNKHMLVITDAFSKYAEVIPLPNQTAAVTADALVWKYFCKHGVPSILHSDQGKNFESAIIQQLCERLNIKKTRTSGYHPAGNGGVERYNKTLIERISFLLEQDDQTDWEEWIPQALFDYHCTPHSSTGLTPSQLHFGRQLRSPLDAFSLPVSPTKNRTAQEYMSSLQRRIAGQEKMAQQNLKQSMEDRKKFYDRKARYTPFAKGDSVLCRDFTCPRGLKPKLLKERWTGPWKVVQVRGPVNYRITRRKGQKMRRVLVHHDRLKLHHSRPDQLRLPGCTTTGEVECDLIEESQPISQDGGHPPREVDDEESDSESDPGVEMAEEEEDQVEEVANQVEEVANQIVQGHAGPVNEHVSRSGRKLKKTQRLIEDPQFVGRK